MATKKTPKTNPSWSDVKTKLGDFHRAGLMGVNLSSCPKGNSTNQVGKLSTTVIHSIINSHLGEKSPK